MSGLNFCGQCRNYVIGDVLPDNIFDDSTLQNPLQEAFQHMFAHYDRAGQPGTSGRFQMTPERLAIFLKAVEQQKETACRIPASLIEKIQEFFGIPVGAS